MGIAGIEIAGGGAPKTSREEAREIVSRGLRGVTMESIASEVKSISAPHSPKTKDRAKTCGGSMRF
jgi:hypothetical protein